MNQIPANILARLEETIQQHSFQDLVAVLTNHVGYVERMVQLRQTINKPITLRTFVKRSGALYAVAGLATTGLACLRQDDLFVLDFKETDGPVTQRALLQVHQRDERKELVWFRVIEFAGDDMERLDALAEKQDVSAKGHTARPVCDPDRYVRRGLSDVAAIIRELVDEVLRLRE